MITEITSGYFIIEIFKFAFQNMCICSSQALTNLLYKSTLKLLEFAFLVWLTSLVTMARGLLPFPWGGHSPDDVHHTLTAAYQFVTAKTGANGSYIPLLLKPS